jgi:hypothetical protein
MPFGREDHQKLSEDWRIAEAQIKAVSMPRKKLTLHLHIIRAVRLLKHVREGYQAEVEATEKSLAILDALNVSLAGKGPHSDKQLDSAIGCLVSFKDDELAKKHAAVKRIVAKGRLEETIRFLEKARQKSGNARAMEISRACALLTSFRERLGKWRDEQIVGMAVHNFKKECALRIERDKWLLAQLDSFVTKLEKIYEYDLFDDYRRSALINLKAMLNNKAPNEVLLLHLRASSRLFRVPELSRVALVEEGNLTVGTKSDFLIGHYGWLYRYVASGQRDKVLAKLDFISTFVSGNKPSFIFRELSNDADRYLKPVLKKFESAVDAYRSIHNTIDVNGAFAAAKAAFAAVRDELKKIIAPELRS